MGANESPSSGRNLVELSTKLVAFLIFFVTVCGAAYAVVTELVTQQIVIEPIAVSSISKVHDYLPSNLNLRIVEKIEQIRAETGSNLANSQTAVTKVDDISFKAEWFEFSVIKLLAPIKAALGLSDRRVTSELTCYRPDCEFETEIEDDQSTPAKVPASPATPPAAKDVLRLRYVAIVQDAVGAKTYQSRLSLGRKNFTREVDVEMLRAAEGILEWTDPVTAASFFYLRSKQHQSRYYMEKYRKRAVTAAKLAQERGRADLCWMNNFLATIAVDETDLIGADSRIGSVPASHRARDKNCDARLHLTLGSLRLKQIDWKSAQEREPDEALMRLAYHEFKQAAAERSAALDVRIAAAMQAARVANKVGPNNLASARNELREAELIAAGRSDLKMKLLVEAGLLEFEHGNLDQALIHLWDAVKVFPGAVEPYVELAAILRDRAKNSDAPARAAHDLAEAESLLHQALNGSPDEQATEIRILLADLAVAAGNNPGAIRELSNVSYELDRSYHQLRSIEFEKRAYSRWLFLLRKMGTMKPDLCASEVFGLAQLRNDASLIFPLDARAATCAGDLGGRWRIVQAYERDCAGKEKFDLATCFETIDDRQNNKN